MYDFKVYTIPNVSMINQWKKLGSDKYVNIFLFMVIV